MIVADMRHFKTKERVENSTRSFSFIIVNIQKAIFVWTVFIVDICLIGFFVILLHGVYAYHYGVRSAIEITINKRLYIVWRT